MGSNRIVGMAQAQMVLSGRGSSLAVRSAAVAVTKGAFSWSPSVSTMDVDITHPVMPAAHDCSKLPPVKLYVSLSPSCLVLSIGIDYSHKLLFLRYQLVAA